MIITVGGLAGTGTTTTAELLSEKLGIPFVSSGSIFRAMAEEKVCLFLNSVSLLKVMIISIKKLIKDKLNLLNLQRI